MTSRDEKGAEVVRVWVVLESIRSGTRTIWVWHQLFGHLRRDLTRGRGARMDMGRGGSKTRSSLADLKVTSRSAFSRRAPPVHPLDVCEVPPRPTHIPDPPLARTPASPSECSSPRRDLPRRPQALDHSAPCFTASRCSPLTRPTQYSRSSKFGELSGSWQRMQRASAAGLSRSDAAGSFSAASSRR